MTNIDNRFIFFRSPPNQRKNAKYITFREMDKMDLESFEDLASQYMFDTETLKVMLEYVSGLKKAYINRLLTECAIRHIKKSANSQKSKIFDNYDKSGQRKP